MRPKRFYTQINASRSLIPAALVLLGLLLVAGGPATGCGEPEINNFQDKGDFKVVYSPVENPEYAKFQKELKVLEDIADNLNNTIALPVDVTITIEECGEVNAFYDHDKQQIKMCYELLDHFAETLSNEYEEDKLYEAVIGATIFSFFHEVGHSLVHILKLPITGKEEDAVDQLSTFVLTDESDEGEQAALDGALALFRASKNQETQVENLAFWDEHSLGEQRFYNIICWVYGQNEQKYEWLVEKDILPADRAQRCNGEYAQLTNSWSTLLKPHLKK